MAQEQIYRVVAHNSRGKQMANLACLSAHSADIAEWTIHTIHKSWRVKIERVLREVVE